MAQQVKISLGHVVTIAGALGAAAATIGGGVAGLDAYIVHVIEREERRAVLAAMCAQEVPEDPEKAQPLLDARAALGGCS